MPAAAHLVAEKANGSVIVVNHEVDRTIVIDIAESDAAADVGALKRRPGQARGLAKRFAASLVVKQLAALGVWEGARLIGPSNGDCSVRDKQVEPAIVVVIEPARAKAGVAESGL